MAERPILMSAPMVRAILDGRKTQTRRMVKVQTGDLFDVRALLGAVQEWVPAVDPIAGVVGRTSRVIRCPYGAPGDLLWIREAFAQPNDQVTIYRATWREDSLARGMDNIPADDSSIRWRPSIHMPRWASRITLRVTDVRVERLQEISEADAKAEGVALDYDPAKARGGTWRGGYRDLWEHINGPGSWAANPWVWAVSFERVTP